MASPDESTVYKDLQIIGNMVALRYGSLEKAIAAADDSNDDEIGLIQFQNWLETMGVQVHDSCELFYYIDIDGSGTIQFSELFTVLGHKIEEVKRREEIWQANEVARIYQEMSDNIRDRFAGDVRKAFQVATGMEHGIEHLSNRRAFGNFLEKLDVKVDEKMCGLVYNKIDGGNTKDGKVTLQELEDAVSDHLARSLLVAFAEVLVAQKGSIQAAFDEAFGKGPERRDSVLGKPPVAPISGYPTATAQDPTTSFLITTIQDFERAIRKISNILQAEVDIPAVAKIIKEPGDLYKLLWRKVKDVNDFVTMLTKFYEQEQAVRQLRKETKKRAKEAKKLEKAQEQASRAHKQIRDWKKDAKIFDPEEEVYKDLQVVVEHFAREFPSLEEAMRQFAPDGHSYNRQIYQYPHVEIDLDTFERVLKNMGVQVEYRELFNHIDTDKSGKIESTELKAKIDEVNIRKKGQASTAHPMIPNHLLPRMLQEDRGELPVPLPSKFTEHCFAGARAGKARVQLREYADLLQEDIDQREIRNMELRNEISMLQNRDSIDSPKTPCAPFAGKSSSGGGNMPVDETSKQKHGAVKADQLIQAASVGDVTKVRGLIHGRASIDAVGWGGVTALMSAARHGRDAVVRALVLEQADPKHTDAHGRTAVDHARCGPAATKCRISQWLQSRGALSGQELAAQVDVLAQRFADAERQCKDLKQEKLRQQRSQQTHAKLMRSLSSQHSHTKLVRANNPSQDQLPPWPEQLPSFGLAPFRHDLAGHATNFQLGRPPPVLPYRFM